MLPIWTWETTSNKKAEVAIVLVESVTLIVTENEPEMVDDPEITPLAVPRVNPVGRLPVLIDQK